MNIHRLNTNEPRDIEEYVDKSVAHIEQKLIKHMDARFTELKELIKDAFPEGDINKHRLLHEQQLESEANLKSLRKSLIEKGTAGLLFTLAVINWEAIKMWLKEVFK